MTSEEWSSDVRGLEEFLDELERIWREHGAQHFCVLLATVTPASPVSRYAWPSSSSATEVSERIRTGSRLYIGTRNITLHRYIVRFSITSGSSHVTMQASPTDTAESKFHGELIIDRNPPIRSTGAPVCKGCQLTVEPMFDPTVVFTCEFEVRHEDSSVSKESRTIVVTPHR